MKRDMDLMRELLLAIEKNEDLDGEGIHVGSDPASLGLSAYTEGQVRYHLILAVEGGYLRGKVSLQPIVSGLTMSGHDFIDATRDSAVWKKTKAAAGDAGGFTLELLGEIAKGFVRTQVEKHTGISLG